MTGRWRKKLLLSLVAIAGLLPPAVFLGYSWFQTTQQMEVRLSRYAIGSIDRADEIFGTAESTLAGMAQTLQPNCSEATYQALRRTVFESIYFQEATLVVDGAVICTSNGGDALPQAVTHTENLIVPEQGIHISAPVSLTKEHAVSVVIHYRAAGNVLVGLHLNPKVLAEPMRKYATEDRITVAIERSDGAVLSQVGGNETQAPEQIQGKRIMLQSQRYPIRAIAIDSSGGLFYNWRQSAVFGGLGLIISALLFLLLYLARDRFWSGSGVEDALAGDQFRVYYQPILDAASGACVGAESLLRWHHPQLGTIMPDTFIASAEESGFIVKLTQWLMQSIVTDTAALLKENPDFHISINLSPLHFSDPTLLADIKSIFGQRVSLQQIVFEVTEHELIMNDDSQALDVLKSIRAMGAPIAIDDFGSGYSSLKYLSHFPFDYLKIDKGFIDVIGTESLSAALVDTIVRVANQFKLKIVAEGVETQTQLAYLQQLKVDYVQGWLFSKALPAEQFKAFVAANKAQKAGVGAAPRQA